MTSTSTLTPESIRLTSRAISAADHPGTIRSYYPFWDARYRPFLLAALAALPRDKFDYKPSPEMFTASQILVHIAETERFWIQAIVEGGGYEDWVVPAKDPKEGWVTALDVPDHKALERLLEESHRSPQKYLDRPVAELSRVYSWRAPNGDERRFTLHFVLDHLQEHEIHHRAQLNLYLRLMGVEPPSI